MPCDATRPCQEEPLAGYEGPGPQACSPAGPGPELAVMGVQRAPSPFALVGEQQASGQQLDEQQQQQRLRRPEEQQPHVAEQQREEQHPTEQCKGVVVLLHGHG